MNQQPSDRSTLDIASYVAQMAQMIALPLEPAHQEGTIANFERIYAIALPLLEFPLPDAIEAAPTFQPDLSQTDL